MCHALSETVALTAHISPLSTTIVENSQYRSGTPSRMHSRPGAHGVEEHTPFLPAKEIGALVFNPEAAQISSTHGDSSSHVVLKLELSHLSLLRSSPNNIALAQTEQCRYSCVADSGRKFAGCTFLTCCKFMKIAYTAQRCHFSSSTTLSCT